MTVLEEKMMRVQMRVLVRVWRSVVTGTPSLLTGTSALLTGRSVEAGGGRRDDVSEVFGVVNLALTGPHAVLGLLALDE